MNWIQGIQRAIDYVEEIESTLPIYHNQKRDFLYPIRWNVGASKNAGKHFLRRDYLSI